ncbi:MAG TPA: thiamine biosynthesis protein ThiS [Ruminococcus sp.]|nr:thiamine biosynthesis protein ThiS [Ruminococcus sp.]HBN11255.1 thiamine biosynthesis protein ThiS [Ruminococcus sp.]HCR74533.1 thiamine biosynthesis protein ThiS [Ruminococcus sp.]
MIYNIIIKIKKEGFFLKFNGQEINLENDVTIKSFLENNGFRTDRVAVELNGSICPKNQFESVFLKNEDSVEVVSFVGGG